MGAEGVTVADELQGRALDEACAKAMGWHTIYFGGCAGESLIGMRGSVDVRYVVPRYSTDPATIDEKLSWLQARCFSEQYGSFDICWQGKTSGGFQASMAVVGEFDVIVWGATLTEALARLCVAVAEREAKT